MLSYARNGAPAIFNVSATASTGWMTDSVQVAFSDYVRRGNGLVAIHSGTAEYDQMRVLRSLLGGVFNHHPEQCPVTVNPRLGHPLSAGSAPFTLKDEHYFMAMDDPEVDVFMTTTSEHGEQPGAWMRVDGTGRVVVLTPGHNVEVCILLSKRCCSIPCAGVASYHDSHLRASERQSPLPLLFSHRCKP